MTRTEAVTQALRLLSGEASPATSPWPACEMHRSTHLAMNRVALCYPGEAAVILLMCARCTEDAVDHPQNGPVLVRPL